MQPSSLVFVAIIVGWVAYLLPQWLRRGDALGQFRGLDRHSAGLRVLDPRPSRSAGPSSARLLPEPGRVSEDGVGGDLADRVADDGAAVIEPVRSPSRRRAGMPVLTAAHRRVRVLSALTAVTLTSWGLALTPLLTRRLAVIASTLLVGYLVALVVTARGRAQQRTTARRAGARREPTRSVRPSAQISPQTGARVSPTSGSSSSSSSSSATAGTVGKERVGEVRRPEHERPGAERMPSVGPTAPRISVPVVVAESASVRVTRELEADASAGDGTWVPIPVPPPTYTLKPTAPRPEPAPLDLPEPTPPAPAPPAADQEVVGTAVRPARPWDVDRTFADDLDLDAVLARRRAANG